MPTARAAQAPYFKNARFKMPGHDDSFFPCCGDCRGMTQRDMLAMQAMKAIIAKLPLHGGREDAAQQTAKRVAVGAYAYAYAMIEEGNRRGSDALRDAAGEADRD